MKHLTHEQITELTQALITERDSLLAQLNEHGTKKGGDWQGSSQAPEGEESDPIDAADQIEELVVNVPLVETLEHQLTDVEDALGKIEKGGYGICEDSGEEIPYARLKVHPSARTKVELAE